ncbi:hypothetical protein BS47DRAFT_198013 [Hydnum rufescens UP504]|uniref:C2H2-type domain-containing protein n=1 Tax=Hydnum rufescens UP504 TaxID=1448309 RepID=A0A9P6B6Y8_9AGAM|nr:hypothetical protein BS47DRAFT_198013 [Hydnum rufescens UP504]
MTPTNFEFHPLMSSEHTVPDVNDPGGDSWTLPIESASGPPDTYTTASSWRVTVNLEPAKRNLCSTCGAHFDRPSALKQHILSHTGEKPHLCNMCPSRFSTLSNLRRHQKSCQAIREHVAHCTLFIRRHPSLLLLPLHRTLPLPVPSNPQHLIVLQSF